MTEPAPLTPATHAARTPDKPAVIFADTGEQQSYRALEEGSARLADWFAEQGLQRGDHVAVVLENHLRYLEIVWAALRAGLYITAINRYLTAGEAAYILADCGARVLISSIARADVAGELACAHRLMLGGTLAGWRSFEAEIDARPLRPRGAEWLGDVMLYSSGTTGRPKGVKRAPLGIRVDQGMRTIETFQHYGYGPEMVYLSPAPLYHAAPLAYTTATIRFGGTVVVMGRFDAAEALRLIAAHRVTHSQWVPTMFIRMLKLPAAERLRHDLSSHRCAIHAAAPCPVETKRAMIEWWGPIVEEYYAGTEANGITRISSAEWLAHPGSVGQAKLGIIHICDEAGAALPAGALGLIYFEREAMPFAYHNDPARTAAAQHPDHPTWSTLGDIGYLDAEGYLYLTDRQSFMIISGGVNIYPQAIEDALVTHPAVQDAAVIGVPDPDLGEAVLAVIEPAPGEEPGPALAALLRAHLSGRIARYMLPKSIAFIETMPRLPTGKLYKHALRARYAP